MLYTGRNRHKTMRISPVMAQLLFVARSFPLLFHSTAERNRTGRFVTEFQGLLNLAMDSGGGKPVSAADKRQKDKRNGALHHYRE